MEREREGERDRKAKETKGNERTGKERHWMLATHVVTGHTHECRGLHRLWAKTSGVRTLKTMMITATAITSSVATPPCARFR